MAPKAKKAGLKETYLAELARRGKESHVYRKYQLIGLEISQALRDERHKALYIKLAKEGNADRLLALAKDVAARTSVKNKGAYFMAILKEEAETRIATAAAREGSAPALPQKRTRRRARPMDKTPNNKV
jgi:hypothetical protein